MEEVCHSVFDRNYTTDTSFRTIIDCIYGLLLEPEPEDLLDRRVNESSDVISKNVSMDGIYLRRNTSLPEPTMTRRPKKRQENLQADCLKIVAK